METGAQFSGSAGVPSIGSGAGAGAGVTFGTKAGRPIGVGWATGSCGIADAGLVACNDNCGGAVMGFF